MFGLLLAAAGAGPGLGDVAIYGFAAPLVGVLLYAIKVLRDEVKAKEQVIDRQNTRIAEQGEAQLTQAERLLPLLTESNRILALAVDALNELEPPADRKRRT